MKNIIVLPIPFDNWGAFAGSISQFCTTFKDFPPGADYELWAVSCWGEPTDELRSDFYGVRVKWYTYYGPCDCISVHQWAARQVEEAFLVCMTSRCHFFRAGWLERFVLAREKHGRGLYGASASFEIEPHICNRAYAIDADLLRAYPIEINGRSEAPAFEAGPKSITRFVGGHSLPCLQVTWGGVQEPKDWRQPENIFRKGNQEEMLVWDRHTDIYKDASPEEQKRLERLTDGE